jgi:hypothetical protein
MKITQIHHRWLTSEGINLRNQYHLRQSAIQPLNNPKKEIKDNRIKNKRVTSWRQDENPLRCPMSLACSNYGGTHATTAQ